MGRVAEAAHRGDGVILQRTVLLGDGHDVCQRKPSLILAQRFNDGAAEEVVPPQHQRRQHGLRPRVLRLRRQRARQRRAARTPTSRRRSAATSAGSATGSGLCSNHANATIRRRSFRSAFSSSMTAAAVAPAESGQQRRAPGSARIHRCGIGPRWPGPARRPPPERAAPSERPRSVRESRMSRAGRSRPAGSPRPTGACCAAGARPTPAIRERPRPEPHRAASLHQLQCQLQVRRLVLGEGDRILAGVARRAVGRPRRRLVHAGQQAFDAQVAQRIRADVLAESPRGSASPRSAPPASGCRRRRNRARSSAGN